MPASSTSRPSSRSSSKRKRPPPSPPIRPPSPSSKSPSAQLRQAYPVLSINNAGLIVGRYLQSFDYPTHLVRPSYEFSQFEHKTVRPPSNSFIRAHREAGKPGEPSGQEVVETRYHCRAYLEPPYESLSASTNGDGYAGPAPAKKAAVLELAKVLLAQGKIRKDLKPNLDGATNVRPRISAKVRRSERANKTEARGTEDNSYEAAESTERSDVLPTRRPPPSTLPWSGAAGVAEYSYHNEPEFWNTCPPFSGNQLFGVKLELVVDDLPAGAPSPRPLLLLTTRSLPFPSDEAPFKVDMSLTDATGSRISVKAHMAVSRVTSLPTFDVDKISAIRQFTEKAVRNVIYRDFWLSLDSAKWLILPLSSGRHVQGAVEHDDIDWDSVYAAEGRHCSPIDMRDLENGFEEVLLTEGGEFSKRWAVKGIRHDLNPESPHPTIEGKSIVQACPIGRGDPTMLREIRDVQQRILEAVPLHASKSHGFLGDLANPQPTIFAMPETAYRSFLSASVYRSITLIPHFIHLVDDHLLVVELNDKLFDGKMEHELLREALSPPRTSANSLACPSYDRLELLGDMLLRFGLTISLYLAGVPGDKVASKRHDLESNNALRDCGRKVGVAPYIRSRVHQLADWPPRGWGVVEGTNQLPPVRGDITKHVLGDKLVADVVESLIGAAYLSSGSPLDNVVLCMKRLSIPLSMDSWADVKRLTSPIIIQGDGAADSLMAILKPKATVFDYAFKDAARADIALTLATTDANKATFEKYKALGHVAMEFIMVEDIWRRFSDVDSGMLTVMRDSRVNERVWSLLALENGLTGLLKEVDDINKERIKDFREGLKRAKQDAATTGRREYWHAAPHCSVLAVRMDAVFGAIWEDADFSLEPLRRIYEERLRPWHDKHCAGPSGRHYHAKAELFSVISGRCLQWAFKSREPEDGTQVADIVCHDEVIATGRGHQIDVAHLRASEEALKALEADPHWLDKWCDCPAKLKARKQRKIVTADPVDADENNDQSKNAEAKA